jgi:hypothetical protein
MQAPYVSSNSGGGWGAGRDRCTPILSLPHDQLHPAVDWMPSLIGDVGLRRAACLWQAVPKKFTRRQLKASVLRAAEAGRRRHDEMSGISSRRKQSADARRGRHSSWSTHSSSSRRGRSG